MALFNCKGEVVMVIFFGVLSAVCLVYYAVIVIYAGFGASFVNFWLLAALGFGAACGVFYLNRKIQLLAKIPKPLLGMVCTVIAAGIILFLALLGCVVSGMVSKPEKKADYVIVLGAQIKGERITKSLKNRLEKAYEYYTDNKDIIIIVSGGQGEGENTSEAFAMKKYLEEKGVPSESIILEDRSTTTNENLKYSYEIIKDRGDDNANVLICSNNFHIFRAVRLAKHIGIKNVEGLAADSDNILLVSYMVRDSIAVFKEVLLGNIGIFD